MQASGCLWAWRSGDDCRRELFVAEFLVVVPRPERLRTCSSGLKFVKATDGSGPGLTWRLGVVRYLVSRSKELTVILW